MALCDETAGRARNPIRRHSLLLAPHANVNFEPDSLSDAGAPPALAGFAFHHVGVACTDIAAEARHLALLGYVPEGAPFNDPVQGIRGMFVTGQSPRLELLQALDARSGGVLNPWLERDARLYHLAYRVTDLAAAIASLRASRAKLVVAPVPAVAFGGRDIAFVMLPNRLLVELISPE